MRQSSSSRRGVVAAGGNNKPPVLLYFSAHDTAEIGYADANNNSNSRPKHVVPLPPLQSLPQSASDAHALFLQYAQPLADLMGRLLGKNDHKQQQQKQQYNSGRRVVVLHAQGLYLNRWWRLAVARILHNVIGLPLQRPMVAFVSTLQVVPMLVLPGLNGSNTNTTCCCCLTVCLTATEVQCMVYAMGHSLDYTYQSCGYSLWDDDPVNNSRPPRTVQELQSRQRQLLSSNNDNLLLIRALCQSLLECPVALRRAAIHNIVVAGTVVAAPPDWGTQLARHLYHYLDNEQEAEDESKQDSKSEVPSNAVVWTGVPVNKTALRPLREHIAVIDFAGTAPSALPWVAASLWGASQQQQQQSASSSSSAGAILPTAWTELAREIEL